MRNPFLETVTLQPGPACAVPWGFLVFRCVPSALGESHLTGEPFYSLSGYNTGEEIRISDETRWIGTGSDFQGEDSERI